MIQNHLWKLFQESIHFNQSDEIISNDIIKHISDEDTANGKVSHFRVDWNKIAKKHLDVKLKELAYEQYYLEKDIKKRLINTLGNTFFRI